MLPATPLDITADLRAMRGDQRVAQACAGGLDRLLHADDFVEGDIVDHHNVAALEYELCMRLGDEVDQAAW